MKSLRSIIIVGLFSLLVLFTTLGWSGYTFYNLEKKKISEQVSSLVNETAITVQNENLTLNNLMASYNDKDGIAKQAFAIGMNGNSGKMQLYFDEEDKEEETNDTLNKKVTVFTKDTLEQMHVEFLPTSVKLIQYFDSLFADTLKTTLSTLPYYIVSEKEGGTAYSFSKDTTAGNYEYKSRPFFINYYEPEVFRVNYNIPPTLIIKNMGAFIAVSLLLSALVILAFSMYYRAYKLQAQATTFKETLFSNITHELKTPLSSLQLIIESIKQDNTKEEDAEKLVFATSELNRMKLIVDKILSYGKLNSEDFALNAEIVDIASVISSAANAMKIVGDQANAVIECNTTENLKMTGDKTLLINMFTSLIDNAIKYNKSNNPEVQISAAKNQKNILITVADNGIGIEETYIEKIFDPFFRVPTGNVHNVKGHGIGLSFVAQVVELHGGHITVSDRQPQGTIFTITLPL